MLDEYMAKCCQTCPNRNIDDMHCYNGKSCEDCPKLQKDWEEE